MARKKTVTAKQVLLVMLIIAVVAFLGFLAYVVFIPMLPVDLLDFSWYTDLVNHASELKSDLAADAGFYTTVAIFIVAAITLFWFARKANK
jgi:hypothetical protein